MCILFQFVYNVLNFSRLRFQEYKHKSDKCGNIYTIYISKNNNIVTVGALEAVQVGNNSKMREKSIKGQ